MDKKDLPFVDELVDIGRVAVFREKFYTYSIECPEIATNRANITEEMCLMRVLTKQPCTVGCDSATLLKKKYGYENQ